MSSPSNPPPLVSVACPVYNIEGLVGETIQSVLDQTYPNWEMVICDDGSSDATGRIADDYASRDSRIRVIHQENSGHPGKTRNRAARDGRGKYIAFLDGDDTWKPDKLAVQVEFLETHPEYDAVHSLFDLIGDPELVRFYEGIWEWQTAREVTFEMLFVKNRIQTSSLVVRTEAYRELGGFDESLELRSGQDYEFFVRLAHRKPIGFVPQRLSAYRIVKGSVSHKKQYNYDKRNFYILEKLKTLGMVTDPRLIRMKEAEIYYNRGIEFLYVEDRPFRSDLCKAFFRYPSDPKKAVTFLFCWMPRFLLKEWLRFLLKVKNRVSTGR